MARVKVFNKSLLEGLVAEASPVERAPEPHPSTTSSPSRSGSHASPQGVSPIAERQSQHVHLQKQQQHLKDMEAQRARRYEQSRADAKAKAALDDRLVSSVCIG